VQQSRREFKPSIFPNVGQLTSFGKKHPFFEEHGDIAKEDNEATEYSNGDSE
jgi:hypothetical protein